MAEPRELTALYEALEEAPGDRVTLLALADWYAERDEAVRSAGFRWMAEQGKAPYRYFAASDLKHHYSEWKEGWYWWTTDEEDEPWGYPAGCVLPHKLWKRLAHTFDYKPVVFKEYETARRAVEALLRVYGDPPPRKRKSAADPAPGTKPAPEKRK